MDGQRALQFRRAGVPIQRIATELGYASTEDALRDIADILDANKDLDTTTVRALELDRLDRLHQALWQKGIDGNPVAIDRLVKISEMRIRLAGVPSAQQGMLQAFDAVVSTLNVTTADGALVAAGRRLCEQLDLTAATGDMIQLSKSMYLIPHLVTVLRELGATPAARLMVEETASVVAASSTARENDLAAFKAKRKSTA